MGLSDALRNRFVKNLGVTLMAGATLIGCDSGGGGGGGGETSGATAETTVLSQQRGIPIPGVDVDFKAGDTQKGDRTGKDGNARVSYEFKDANPPERVRISGKSPDINPFSQSEPWGQKLDTRSVAKEQRKTADYTVSTLQDGNPTDKSIKLYDNLGDGDGNNLLLDDGATGTSGKLTGKFKYLGATDSVRLVAGSSTQARIASTESYKRLSDLEQSIQTDTTKTRPSRPGQQPSQPRHDGPQAHPEQEKLTPRRRTTRDKSAERADRRTRQNNERITPGQGNQRPLQPNTQVQITRIDEGITTEYTDSQTSTTIDTTVAIDDLQEDGVTLTFDDPQDQTKTATVQGQVKDSDTGSGRPDATVDLTPAENGVKKTAFTDLNGQYQAKFDVSTEQDIAITTDVQGYTTGTITIPIQPPSTGSDTTITADPISIQRNIYDATVTPKSDGNTVPGANGELIINGETRASFNTGQNGGTAQIESDADSLTAIVSKSGYRDGSTTRALQSDRALTLNPVMDLIEYDVAVNAEDQDGNPVDVSVTLNDKGGQQDADPITLNTGSDGQGTFSSLSTRDGFEANETIFITYKSPNHNTEKKTLQLSPDNTSLSSTATLTESTSKDVTATINAETTQESQVLPGATIEYVNADADTTIGTISSDGNGNSTFQTFYPEDQAYTLLQITDTPEHKADTTSIDLGTTDKTYTTNPDLERLIHTLTINTDDANTGNPVDATGNITAGGAKILDYNAGSDGVVTAEIETQASNATSVANTTNYDEASQPFSLGGSKNVSVTNQLNPIQYQWGGNVDGPQTFNVTLEDNEGNTRSITASDSYTITGSINQADLEENESGTLTFNADGWVAKDISITADPNNRTKTRDITLEEQTQTVNATFNGNTSQEGATLPNADITIRNADADTTVTSTTSDGNGYYQATTSYPDDQPYTAQIISNTSEHQADTTLVDLGTTDKTYTTNPDLERLVHKITINTNDANTGNPVAATGSLTYGNTTLTEYTTNGGDDTVTITTSSDQITNQANTKNYDGNNQDITLGADKNISTTLTLPPIQYTWDVNVDDQAGNPVEGASVNLTDPQGNGISATTDATGTATATGSINNGDFEENEGITAEANNQGYNPASKTTSADPNNRNKTLDITIEEESTLDRIPVTFTTKTVGDTLYTGDDYGETLTYQVSTDDTTFTTTGSTTADVPIADGDRLEISTSDSEYLSTVVANNTDTEPKPFNVSGFPDEPDYQNTTIGIPKSDVVNQYQVVGFPDTSPDGRDVGDIYVPFVNEATRFKDREVNGETLDEDKLYVIESDDDNWNDRAATAISDVRDVIPFPTTDPVYVPDENALNDSVSTRDNYNFSSMEVGPDGNFNVKDGGYLQASKSSAGLGSPLSTHISEVYSGMVDMEEQNGTEILGLIIDDNGEFDKTEAALPVSMEYHTKAGSSLQP